MKNLPCLLIGDRYPLYLDALCRHISEQFPLCTIVTKSTYAGIFEYLHGQENYAQVNLLLMDLSLPGCKGLEALAYVREQFPNLDIIVLYDDECVLTQRLCVSFGVRAILYKTASVDTIISTLQSIFGLSFKDFVEEMVNCISPAQDKVAKLLLKGWSNKLIAKELNISEKTVKQHVSAILTKIGVDNRTQAALLLSNMYSI